MLVGCGPKGSSLQQRLDIPTAVVLMTFNVENLFDTQDDAGRNDETFLPLKWKHSPEHREAQKVACRALKVRKWRDQCLYWDWNEAHLTTKLQRLADAILQVNGGRGPDILVLQEVENRGVLERLRTDYLNRAGYRPAILLEGKDARGIDIAFLSRLPQVGEPELHEVTFPGERPSRVRDTRGILEATFRLPDGNLITGFGVHFPAPFLPWQMRARSYAQLNRLRAGLPSDRAAFAAGDFNTTAEDDSAHQLLAEFVRPNWVIAHETGCEPCKGTYYYAPKKAWSFLDMILWSPAESVGQSNWQLEPGSVEIVQGLSQQSDAQGHPQGYDLPEGLGVSDHWPLSVRIEKRL